MLSLYAPYPATRVTVVLPSPRWSDSIGLTSTMQTLKAMDGTTYTYVHAKDGRKRLQWDFKLSRHKALELRAFVRIYFRSKLKVVDHNNDTWIGYLVNNPFEYTGSGRAFGFPGEETMDITLEFEEAE